MNTYNYFLHQLKISSNISIADLIQLDKYLENPDIIINAVEINNDPSFPAERVFELTEDYFYLAVKNIAVYEITGKNTINIKYNSQATPEEISLFLLGSCLGVILYQRGFLPFHASSVYISGKGAIFFTGDSGAGKSTILNALLQKGYKMISDDVNAIKISEKPLVYPSFPKVKLWQDTADKLNIDTSALKKISKNYDKYSKPVIDELFHNEICEPYMIYEINKYKGDSVILEEISPVEKVQLIYRNTYRVHYLEKLNKHQEHFQQVGVLANSVKVKKIYRPENKDTISEIIDLLEKDFL